jgi:profilin
VKAAIHGHDGSLWATSKGFAVRISLSQAFLERDFDQFIFIATIKIGGTEIATLSGAFKDPTPIRSNGLHVAGTKYFCLRADDRSIYGKQVFFKPFVKCKLLNFSTLVLT